MPEDSREDLSSPRGLRSLYSLGSKRSGSSERDNRRLSYNTPAATELYKAQGIPITKEKCKACVVAALVADSASVNLDRLSSANFQTLVDLPEFNSNPEFFQGARHVDLLTQSRLSMYGNEMLPLLQSLVTHGGLDGLHYTATSYEFFKQYKGKKSPLAQRFLTVLAKGVHFPAGLAYNSMQCLTKAPMLVARYAGKIELDLKLRDAVRAQQTNLDATQLSLATAKILERIVLGSSIFEALTWSQSSSVLDTNSQKHVQTVLQSMSIPHSVFVAKTGKNDKLPAAFLTSLHAAATANSYQEAVRQTLKAGGSGMSGRAQLAGAFLAAEAGLNCIPDDWKACVAKFEEYEELASKLISQRAIVSILPP